MKKKLLLAIVSMLLCFACLLSLASCANQTAESSSSESNETTPPENQGDDQNNDNEQGDDMQNTDIKTINDIKPSNGSKVKIAFVGDSLTEGVGASNRKTYSYPAQLSRLIDTNKYVVGNFGKGGAYLLDFKNPYNVKTTEALSYRNTEEYKESKSFNADVVVIMLGVNDIRSMSAPAAWDDVKAALISLAREYAEMETVQRVYIATSIRISNAAAIAQGCDGPLQELQREVADELGYDLIDMYSMTREYMNAMLPQTADRVHPDDALYAEMAKVMKAALWGEEYTAPIAEKSSTGVVFVKSSGTQKGNGETPETAVNTLVRAVSLLRDGGGTIVICGPYSTTYETHTPIHSGNITITSKYNGTDYSQSGAKLGIANNIYLYGDFKFENLNINVEVSMPWIAFNYNNVTFGEGLVCTLASGMQYYPVLIAGYNIGIGGVPLEDVSLHGECNVIISSGDWSYIRGGNRRSSAAHAMGSSDTDAKLNLTINGGTFHNTATNFCSATGMSGFAGTATMTINGGTFMGDVYAVSRAGGNTTSTKAAMTGTVHLIINGGTFNKSIRMTQDGTVSVTGTVKVTYAAQYESKIVGFTNKVKK